MEDSDELKKANRVTFDEVGIAEHDQTRGTRMKITEAPTPFRRMSREEQSPETLANSLRAVDVTGSTSAQWSARAEEGDMADDGPTAAWEDRLAASLAAEHAPLPSALGYKHPHAGHPHFNAEDSAAGGGAGSSSSCAAFVPGEHDAERASAEHARFESVRKAHYAGEAKRVLQAKLPVDDDEDEDEGDGDEHM